MSRFNKTQPAKRVAVPLAPEKLPTLRTGNGAPGFARDAKGELFTLAVANFVSQDSFYEPGKKRDERYASLIHTVAVADPKWMAQFLKWLRNDANMRTASVVGSLEAAAAMLGAKIPGGRQLIDSVLIRADEPGEALGYWLQTYGRKIPKPVKRGIADAAGRLYSERNALKYDTASHGLRFGDVLELCHPEPTFIGQGDVFKFLIDRRHDRAVAGDGLPHIQANTALRISAQTRPEVLLDAAKLRFAGMTWEDVLSLAGSKVDKKLLWEAMIPNMGYMALLRNLRNFEQAGLGRDMQDIVAAKLRDRSEVQRSRQLPMRFLSAYRAVQSSQFLQPIEEALELSVGNIPTLRGRTLILVDTSGSMNVVFSKDGTLKRWDAAALFGITLAKACEYADVVAFSNSMMPFHMDKGMSILRALDRWKNGGFFMGGGTATELAIRSQFKNHDRIIVLTDEQANMHWGRDVFTSVPQDRMCITFNLAGDKVAHAAGSHTRVTVAGLSDAGFKMIGMLENRVSGKWPWEV